MFVIPCKFRADIIGIADPNQAIQNALVDGPDLENFEDTMISKCVESIKKIGRAHV